jgi:hypothetical protein
MPTGVCSYVPPMSGEAAHRKDISCQGSGVGKKHVNQSLPVIAQQRSKGIELGSRY